MLFGSSNVGLVRNENQDSYVIDTLENGICFAVVCDGMGGANGGKIASLTAVNSFSSIVSCICPDMSRESISTLLDNAIEKANIDVFNKSNTDKELRGMGTTLVAAVVIQNKVYILNVGDSRCYILKNDKIRRITRDHSAVQELVDHGMLTETQARNHPNKNIITRALGVERNVEYDLFIEEVDDGDFILLCTDGVTNYVDDLEIPFEIIKNPETVPQRLIDLANSRGGADNSTVVIINVQGGKN